MGIKKRFFIWIAIIATAGNIMAQNAIREYRVVLILPFHSKGGNVSLRNAMLDYYEGFKMSAEDLAMDGLNLKLYIFDHTKDSTALERILDHPDLPKMDVIVGPVYDKNIDTVSQFCDRENILFVSPLRYYNNPNPGHPMINFYVPDSVKLRSMVEKTLAHFPNHHYVIANDNSEVSIENTALIRRKLKLAGIRSVKILNVKDIITADMIVETDSVILLSATENISLKPVLEKSIAGKRHSYLIAHFNWYEPIKNTKDIHQPNIIYSSSNFIDPLDSSTRSFKKKFKSMYYGLPSKYAYIGYDQATYIFYGLMAYNKKFYNYLPNASYQGLANIIKLEGPKEQIENHGFFFVQIINGKRTIFEQ